MPLAIGALFGLFSIAFGAYAEHGLKANISNEAFSFLMTAVRYNQIHAVVLVMLGLNQLQASRLPIAPMLNCAALAFILGTLMFSFSIYASVVFALPALTRVTPIGGMVLMLGWGLLTAAGFRGRKFV